MRKTPLLLVLLGLLALTLGFGLGLSTSTAAAAELAVDNVVDCPGGGRGGPGDRGTMDIGRFFKDCGACDSDTPVLKGEFLACVEGKLGETDLTPEQQTEIYNRIAAKIDLMDGDYVTCPERDAIEPQPSHDREAIGLRSYHYECAACDGDTPVSLDAFVACVQDKLAQTDLSDEMKAKILEMAGQVPTDEDGNVLCPDRSDEPDPGRLAPSGPGRGRRGH